MACPVCKTVNRGNIAQTEVYFGRMNLEQCRAALTVLKTIDKGDL